MRAKTKTHAARKRTLARLTKLETELVGRLGALAPEQHRERCSYVDRVLAILDRRGALLRLDRLPLDGERAPVVGNSGEAGESPGSRLALLRRLKALKAPLVVARGKNLA